MANDSFRIQGRVIDQNRKGVPGLRIESWDKERVYTEAAGSAKTDKDGAFRIELAEDELRRMFKDRRPDLYFKIYRGPKLIKSTEREIARKVIIGETRVLLQVEMDIAQIIAMPEEEAPPPPPAPEPPPMAPPPMAPPMHAPQVVEKVVEKIVMQAPAAPEKKKPRAPEGAEAAASPPPAPEVTVHRIAGTLVDASTGEPLAGLTVQARDDERNDLGSDVSSPRGTWALQLPLQRGTSPVGKSLHFKVFDGKEEVADRHVELHSTEPNIELRATPHRAEAGEPTRLEEVQSQAGVHMPVSVNTFLGRRGIYTIDDVRTAGGIGHLQGLPVASDAESVRQLEAHAGLGLLVDTRTAAYLIGQGYPSVRAIAEAAPGVFVARVKDQLNEFGAAQLHAKARAQVDLYNNVQAAVQADQASNVPSPLSSIQALAAPPVEVRDDESALSHAAYLCDLLDLARHHLTDEGRAVALDAIEGRLHQPIGSLAAGGASPSVRQVRIAVEVLRGKLGATGFEGEEEYRKAAYHALLDAIGTSYDELRRSRAAGPERRAKLAERLDLDGVDRLDALLIDLDRPRALTEKTLEELFGLVDTTRAPLDLPTEGPRLQEWRKARLRARWRAQDRPASPLGARPILDPDVVTLADLRLPQPGQQPYIILTARRNWVDSALEKLGKRCDAEGFDAIISESGLPHDLAKLKAGVEEGDPDALREVQKEHDLTLESFRRIVELREKSDKEGTLSADEWKEATAIVVQAKKVRQFAAWAQEEQGAVALGPAQFVWLHRSKNELTKWLATAETRAAYEEGLRRKSAAPVVDPDLLAPGDFVNPASGDGAWDLYTARKERVERQIAGWRAQTSNQSGKLDSGIATALQITTGEWQEVAEKWRAGQDLEARLLQLALDGDALGRLMALREALGGNQAALDSEWDEVYQLLAQAWKRRQFGEWRDEEESENLVLGPDHFRVHDDPRFEIPSWRGSVEARRAWQETLAGRAAEDEANRARLSYAIDLCEEGTLPSLRDALLIAAGDKALDLDENARKLGGELHIDLRQSGGVKTTRLSQAIESVQALLAAARASGVSGLSLDPADTAFDEAWGWMRSYDSWRSALFAFLYPENLLSAELRQSERQSPAFRALVEELGDKRITSEHARRVADRYAEYFADVCGLTVEASAVAPTRQHRGDARHRTQAVSDVPMLYLFARGKTNNIYWSACEAKDTTGYGQSFWEKVPGLERAGRIVGAAPYFPSDEQHFLLLFAQVSSMGAPRLVCTRYDLIEERWSGELIDLDLPGRGVFSVAVEQRDTFTRPPRLVISQRAVVGGRHDDVDLEGYGLLWARRLNRPGNGWQSRDFRLLLADQQTDAVFALVNCGDRSLVFFGAGGNLKAGVFSEASEGELERVSTMGAALWVGALQSTTGEVVAIARRDYGHVQHGVISVEKIGKEHITLEHAGPAGIVSLPTSCGNDGESTRLIAYQRRRGGYRGRLTVEEGRLVEREAKPAVPAIDGPFDVPSHLPESALQLRAQRISSAFTEVASGPLSNLIYLEEAWFFVPMLIGKRLHDGGQYAAALDWYRTVYDPSAPEKRRQVYAGFQQNAQAALGQRAADWLLDPLNPHALAETRGGSYLRFTMLSIARCLADYAEAELARDTADSRPRARRLFAQAEELLGASELRAAVERGVRLGELEAAVPHEWRAVWTRVRDDLKQIVDAVALKEVVDEAKGIFNGNDSWDAKLDRARSLVKRTRENLPGRPTVGDVLSRRSVETAQADIGLLAQVEVVDAARRVAEAAGADFLHGVSALTGASAEALSDGKVDLPWLVSKEAVQAAPPQITQRGGQRAAAMGGRRQPERVVERPVEAPQAGDGRTTPATALAGLRKLQKRHVPVTAPRFAAPPNPRLIALRRRVEQSLAKLRAARTVAADRRQPERHRFDALVARATEMARLAGRLEEAARAAADRRAAGEYTLLEARQHLALLEAVAQLHGVRAEAAIGDGGSARRLAHRARARAQLLSRLLDEGTRAVERASLDLAAQAAAGRLSSDWVLPSYESRAAAWESERAQAQADLRVALEESDAAAVEAGLLDDERTLAHLDALEAQSGAEFLGRKFSDRELFGWMTASLGRVARRVCAEGAATARLALDVAAFEKQEPAAPVIQRDYAEARALVEDLARLGEWRASRGRRIELSKTISAARVAPEALARFQRTGVLTMATPAALFDREDPGHYLRLVKRVSVKLVSTVRLPSVRASLTAERASRVLAGPPWRNLSLLRGPDEMSLTSSGGGPGEIALATRDDGRPFDGVGVDTTWELTLPPSAHAFDYRVIGDVLLTIDYSALPSAELKPLARQMVGSEERANRPFSLRAQFAEAWYDLHNPERAPTPMSVRFSTRREDFPPHLERLHIEDVALQLVPRNGERIEIEGVQLTYAPQGSAAVGGAASSVDGLLSSRAAGSWRAIRGLPPVGEWQLTLPDAARERFRGEQLADLLLVVSYAGERTS